MNIDRLACFLPHRHWAITHKLDSCIIFACVGLACGLFAQLNAFLTLQHWDASLTNLAMGRYKDAYTQFETLREGASVFLFSVLLC